MMENAGKKGIGEEVAELMQEVGLQLDADASTKKVFDRLYDDAMHRVAKMRIRQEQLLKKEEVEYLKMDESYHWDLRRPDGTGGGKRKVKPSGLDSRSALRVAPGGAGGSGS